MNENNAAANQVSGIFDRMLEAAHRVGVHGHSDLARLLGEFPQTITNWQARGVPAAKILDIASALRCDPYWLRDGFLRTDAQVASANVLLEDKVLLMISKAIGQLPEEKRRALATLIGVPLVE